MEGAANRIASMLEGMPMNYNAFVGSVVGGTIEAVKDTIDCEVIIVNRRGNPVQSTLGREVYFELPADALKTVMSGRIYRRQAVFIEALGNSYTVGVPIEGDGGVNGCVFITARQVRVGSAMRGIFLTYLICGLSVLLFAMVLLYFITRQITRPLNEMAIAARAYANGDFSRRIVVAPEGELGALAATFNNMAENLDRLETMRRGFIADVSHELRTPMTTIGGFIDGILDGTIPPESEQKYLALVSDEVKRLSRMVNNLLDVARIQSGEIAYRREPYDFTELAQRVVLSLEDRLREKEIDLQFSLPEEPFIAMGDRDAIYRVVYNLMDNAVKFTPEQGKIWMRLIIKEQKYYFALRNSGEGIPEAEVGQIFERFYKVDRSRGENRRGVGLGLYMVKSIIDAHGEDMIVSSKEGEFAEFSFSLTPAQSKL